MIALQLLAFFGIIVFFVGMLVIVARIFDPDFRYRRDDRDWMLYDNEDRKRKIAAKGVKEWLGFK